MRHDGYDSDATVAATSCRRRRREICRSFTCISPWFIFCRWLNGGKSRVSRNSSVERNWGKEKMGGDFGVRRKSGIVSSSSRRGVSETGKEASFNLGVGFGLIYLVRNELNKMVELRKRIELLLQNFQSEIEDQEKKNPYMPSRSSISSSLSRIRAQDILYGEEHDRGQILSPEDEMPQIGFGSNRFRREKSLRMDQLEAELEAEFDRLQPRMDDGEFHLNYSQEQYPEINMEDNAPEVLEEVCDQLHELSNSDFYGVCPRDLETRLHQVLETRQQERIDELESALDYAMEQLEERERELSCWKDAARIISHHLPFIPSLLRQVKQAMEAEIEVIETGKCLIRNSISECNSQAM